MSKHPRDTSKVSGMNYNECLRDDDSNYLAWRSGREDKESQHFRPEMFPAASEERINYELGYEGIPWDLEDYDLGD
jgi:hypothetical protein